MSKEQTTQNCRMFLTGITKASEPSLQCPAHFYFLAVTTCCIGLLKFPVTLQGLLQHCVIETSQGLPTALKLGKCSTVEKNRYFGTALCESVNFRPKAQNICKINYVTDKTRRFDNGPLKNFPLVSFWFTLPKNNKTCRRVNVRLIVILIICRPM